MSTPPQVSIIIPTHNRPVLLQRSLASALAQRDVAVEVIVVDDGSEPPAVVSEPSAVALIRTERQGASAARNAGLARAGGDYVMFLDSDDWLEPDAVVNLIDTARAAGTPVASGGWRNVEESTGQARETIPVAPYADGLANAVAGHWVAGSFLMARSIAARFDPSLTLWEVAAFLCESLATGTAAADCGTVVVNIAQHADQDRISVRHDHFEPLTTARAFTAMKARLAGRGLLGPERTVALDAKLLTCLHALLRSGRREAEEVHRAIDWPQAHRQIHYRPASFAWCARWGGLPGARGFVALNRALGR